MHAGDGGFADGDVPAADPEDRRLAASRAAVRAMCMSATMCWAAWNEAIGLPNWCRMVV